MSNLLGVWLNVPRGQEILCDELAHIVRAEHGSHANLHGITSRTWSSGGTGLASAAVIEALIAPPAGFLVQTAGVEIENRARLKRKSLGGGMRQAGEILGKLLG